MQVGLTVSLTAIVKFTLPSSYIAVNLQLAKPLQITKCIGRIVGFPYLLVMHWFEKWPVQNI